MASRGAWEVTYIAQTSVIWNLLGQQTCRAGRCHKGCAGSLTPWDSTWRPSSVYSFQRGTRCLCFDSQIPPWCLIRALGSLSGLADHVDPQQLPWEKSLHPAWIPACQPFHLGLICKNIFSAPTSKWSGGAEVRRDGQTPWSTFQCR